METVHEALASAARFDAGYVYETLHHAHDWRQALLAAHACLRDGGWLLVCREPNRVHTLSAYRVATLSGTQEIGFSRGELMEPLRAAGFGHIVTLRNLHFSVRPHWLAARR